MNRSSDRYSLFRDTAMSRLSSFLQSGLARRQKAGGHPDANVLAAFSARTLSRNERTSVLSHLEECPECREVLALSSSHALKASRRSQWVWPVASAIAAACAVFAIVWLPQLIPHTMRDVVQLKPSRSQLAALSKAPVSVPAPAVQPARIPEAERPHRSPKAMNQTTRDRREGEETQPVAPNAPAPANLVLAPSSPVSVPSNPVLVPSISDEIAAAQPAAPATSAERSGQFNALRPAPGRASAQQALIGPAPSAASAAPQSVITRSGIFGGQQARLRKPPAGLPNNGNTVWSLEPPISTGSVRKSVDGGKTWQAVPVDGATEFYALSATGSDIWVGGAGGNLFHSVDDGVDWQEIPVIEGRTRLSEAITSIEPDGDTVTLKAASGARWTTQDGGKHWRLER